MIVTYLAVCTFNPPALKPPQPGSALVINAQLSSDCSKSHKICRIVLRGSPFCVCFSAYFVPEIHEVKLEVPRMFSQLLWVHDYHTFHGNWVFAWENDSQEIFICIETCRICTSHCNDCMWKGRCKAIHTLTLFIHNWKHKMNRSVRKSLISTILSLTWLLSLTPKQQMHSESFCLPTLKEQEIAWTSLSLEGESKMRLILLPFLRLWFPWCYQNLSKPKARTAGPVPYLPSYINLPHFKIPQFACKCLLCST